MQEYKLPIPEPILKSTLPILGHFMNPLKLYNLKLVMSSVHFLFRFYSRNNFILKEYFVTLVASTHLSSKINECSLSLGKIAKEIIKMRSEENLLKLLNELGSPDSERDKFILDLAKDAAEREMEIITSLNFDFSVPFPFDLTKIYIERIFSWHFPMNLTEIKFFLENDSYRMLLTVYSVILTCAELYAVDIEMLSMVSAQIIMDHYRVPIKSLNGPWYHFFNSAVKKENYEELLKKIDKLIIINFEINEKPYREDPLMPIEMEFFDEFIMYPIESITRDSEPLCPPPPFEWIASLVPNDQNSIFIKNYADHVPLCPPGFNESAISEENGISFSTKPLNPSTPSADRSPHPPRSVPPKGISPVTPSDKRDSREFNEIRKSISRDDYNEREIYSDDRRQFRNREHTPTRRDDDYKEMRPAFKNEKEQKEGSNEGRRPIRHEDHSPLNRVDSSKLIKLTYREELGRQDKSIVERRLIRPDDHSPILREDVNRSRRSIPKEEYYERTAFHVDRKDTPREYIENAYSRKDDLIEDYRISRREYADSHIIRDELIDDRRPRYREEAISHEYRKESLDERKPDTQRNYYPEERKYGFRGNETNSDLYRTEYPRDRRDISRNDGQTYSYKDEIHPIYNNRPPRRDDYYDDRTRYMGSKH